jgi:hypothetical protein
MGSNEDDTAVDAPEGGNARQAPPDTEQLTRSSRNPDELRNALGEWLNQQLPNSEASVLHVEVPEANGMSSETLLVTATWADTTTEIPQEHHLVARVEPAASDVPVFPTYDLTGQFEVLGLVAARSDGPIRAMGLWVVGLTMAAAVGLGFALRRWTRKPENGAPLLAAAGLPDAFDQRLDDELADLDEH